MLDDGLNDSMWANIGNTSHSRKDQEAPVQLVREGDLFEIPTRLRRSLGSTITPVRCQHLLRSLQRTRALCRRLTKLVDHCNIVTQCPKVFNISKYYWIASRLRGIKLINVIMSAESRAKAYLLETNGK